MKLILKTVIISLFLSGSAFACACGCSVFSVGARWMLPISPGFRSYLLFNYMDQLDNWNNWGNAPSLLNGDKEIRTSFYTLGLQYMFDRDWGVTVELPYWDRFARLTDDDGEVVSSSHDALSDVRVIGMYSGLSADMSTGIEFGLKIPTGPFNQPLLDRDTQIGSGTTDLLLGGYRMGQESGWGWYTQVMWQHAFNERDGYRPGDSFDANVGIHYDNLLNEFHVIPMFQLIGSFRAKDSGVEADPDNTGYSRLYLSPSLELIPDARINIYFDLRIPILTRVSGYQLVAPSLVSATFGYNF